MKEQIVGAIVGAIITGLFSMLIFHLGNFSTQESIVESLSVRFDSVDESMSYEQALEVIYQERASDKNKIESLNKQISNLNLTINDLNTEIDKKQLEIANQESQDEIDKIIQNATDYWNASDYIQCLTLLRNSKSKSIDIETLYEQYSNEYVIYLLSKADSLSLEKKYDEAISLINDNLIIVSDDTILKQKIEEIKQSKPKNLISAISPYEIKGYTEKNNGEFMQMGGNKFYNGFQLGESWYTSYAIFNLKSKYKKITGIIGHIDGSGESDKTVTIFADGILIDTIDIKYQELPKEFSVNVEGVNQLKFERTDGSTQTGFGDLILK